MPRADSSREPSRFFGQPWLLILIGLVIFAPLLQGGTTHLAVMIIRLMILLLLSFYLAREIRAGVLTCPPFRIGPAVLAFLGLAGVLTAASPYTNQSLQWLVVLLSYAGLLYLLVSFFTEWDHVRNVLLVLVGMMLLEAGWALVQVGWFEATRPSGTFFNPNFLAGYLAVGWTLVLSYLCYVSPKQFRWRPVGVNRLIHLPGLILPVVALGVLLVAIVWTGSRGGLLATLAGTALILGVRFGRKGIGVLVLLVLIGVLLPSPLRDRLEAEHAVNPVSYARWQMWQNSVRLMLDYPLGTGLGLYQYMAPRYAFPVEGEIIRYGKVAHFAHNEYLQMGVELGIVSIPIFCWGVVVMAREAASVLRQRLRRWQRSVIVGVSGGITAILLHAAVDSNLHEPAVALVLILYASIILSAHRLARRATEPVRSVPMSSRWLWAGVGTTVVVVLAIVVTRLGLAWMAFEEGSRAATEQDSLRAIAYHRNATALDPGKALYHSSLAAAYFHAFERNGNRVLGRASLAELRLAGALNPLDGRLSALLGHVYLSLAAQGVPRELLDKESDKLQKGWTRLAVLAYERAADLEPFNPYYHLELGRLYAGLGNRQEAEAIVQRAVEIEPNFLPGRKFLAQLYLDLEKSELAMREYREIIERRERYADRPKDPVEQQFLELDLVSLEAALEELRLQT
ncbi:MAG: O-antigen ligase family protein [Nitrospirota bacterium]|nr:O-antigen ligase family protein [Nitrospirota bacterium]